MKRRKIMALALASLMSVGVLSSCGKGPGGLGGKVEKESVADKNKTTLYVATFNGGVGYEWLDEAAKRFESLYADVSFESGKKGVTIDLAYDKDNYGGTTLADKTLTKDVYFTEGVEYYKYVNDGKVADITDVVTQPIQSSISKFEESGKIADKLDEIMRSYLTAKDGKYYMLPFYDGFYGFMYDVDLFEEEGFYFDEFGDNIKRADGESQASYDAKKSAGPNGVKGDYDDGLPQTYDQFLELVDYIVGRNCIPFCYTGSYSDYVSKAFRSFIADYEGEAFRLNYTLRGNDVELANVDADGNVEIYKENITPDNAYLLKKQAGNYYALMMQEKLFGSNKYSGGKWNAFDYTEAQREFIKSKYTTTRYAMLVEGIWWENEATSVFDDMYKLKGESKSDRRFAFLPIPKANEDRLGEQTMFAANNSFAFINADCKQMELAKEFMRFLHTDAEMSKFTAKTSIPRSLKYEVSSEDRAKATHFGKSIIDMRANATIVYPYSAEDLILNNSASFTDQMWYLTSTVNGQTRNNPFTAFKDGVATAIEYFNGLYTRQFAVWATLEK